MTPIALIDMDETIADYKGHMKHYLRLLESPCELFNKRINECKKTIDVFSDDEHMVNRRRIISNMNGFWETMPIRKCGMWIMHYLYDLGFEITILTKGPTHIPKAWSEKVQWCQKNIQIKHKISIVEDKSLVYGHILVDDYTDYAVSWLNHRPRGLVILPLTELNKDFTHKNAVILDYNDVKSVLSVLSAVSGVIQRIKDKE